MPWAASPAAANTTATGAPGAGGISSAGMHPASRSKLSWVDMNRAAQRDGCRVVGGGTD
ncbi:hypothetical protein V495_08048, partial [Pseudogymnoascus sp. VKM F-4514 (FW-929)]